MAFFAYQNELNRQREAQAAALRQALAVVEAQKQAEIERQQKYIEAQKNADVERYQKSLESQAQQGRITRSEAESGQMKEENKLVDARQLELMHQGMDPGEALLQARKDIRDIKLQPALQPATTALNLNELQRGIKPYASFLGEDFAKSLGSGYEADTAGNILRGATNQARFTTAPTLAATQDQAKIEQAINDQTQAQATRPWIPGTTVADAKAKMAEANEKESTALLGRDVTERLDPDIIAKSQRDVTQMHPLLQATAAATPIVSQPGISDEVRGQYLPITSTALSQLGDIIRRNQPGAPSTNALPRRIDWNSGRNQ